MSQIIQSNQAAPQRAAKMTYVRNEAGDFVCPDCGKVVSKHRQPTMSMHMKKHLLEKAEEKPFACAHCAIPAFLTKAALDAHMTRLAGRGGHPTPTDTLNEITCPFDGCAFSDINKGNVRTHCMRVHVGDEVRALLERGEAKDIKCKNCSLDFNNLGSFYYHSIGCVSLQTTDPRHGLLAQLV